MKAAPEGVIMVIRALWPANNGLMDFHRENITTCNDLADEQGFPRFSALCKRDLYAFGLDSQAVDLIESVTRLGNFTDQAYYQAERKSMSHLKLARYGEKQPRGKRTRPGMLEFVAELTPKLLFYGFQFKTGGRSRLVSVLQTIADEIRLEGDPRDELRRLARKKITEQNKLRSHMYAILANAIRPTPRVATQ